jgi:dissimilatory sulfite reductase (desulfoviridin) alpha/beta subunit
MTEDAEFEVFTPVMMKITVAGCDVMAAGS